MSLEQMILKLAVSVFMFAVISSFAQKNNNKKTIATKMPVNCYLIVNWKLDMFFIIKNGLFLCKQHSQYSGWVLLYADNLKNILAHDKIILLDVM